MQSIIAVIFSSYLTDIITVEEEEDTVNTPTFEKKSHVRKGKKKLNDVTVECKKLRMEQQQHLGNIKVCNEERMAAANIEYQKEIHELQRKNIMESHQLEMKIKKEIHELDIKMKQELQNLNVEIKKTELKILSRKLQ